MIAKSIVAFRFAKSNDWFRGEVIMSFIRRFQETRVLDTMKAFPATYISGPRQAGKTTLVRDILADRFDGRHRLGRCSRTAITVDTQKKLQ